MDQRTLDRTDDLAELPAQLRRRGLLPSDAVDQPFSARVLGPPRSAVLAHLDPGRMLDPGRARMVAHNAVSADTMSDEHKLFLFRKTNELAFIVLEFSGLAPLAEAVVSLDVRVQQPFGPPSSALRITATGNPAVTVVTFGTTGGARTTVHVPLRSPDFAGFPSIVELAVEGEGQGVHWHGADLRLM